MNKALLIALALLPCLALADKLTLFAENDVLNRTDGFYTHGSQIRYETDDHWGLQVSQLMYTPENKDSPDPQYGDRPYCGVLKAQFSKEFLKANSGEYIGLTLGVVGPASGAEQTQKAVHWLINSAQPMGWDWQLFNEPIANLALYKTYSLPLTSFLEYRPLAGVNLGNELTDAEAGNIVRLGWNMPKSFSPFIGTFEEDAGKLKDKPFGCYLFAGVIGKLKLYDITLDGNLLNTRENYVTVDKKAFVAQGFVGAGVRVWRVDVVLTHIQMTEEFENQPLRDNVYDSLQLGVTF